MSGQGHGVTLKTLRASLLAAGCLISSISTWAAEPASLAKPEKMLLASHDGSPYPMLLGMAVAGNVSARLQLGSLYEQGQPVGVGFDRIIKWYKQAAQSGSAEAQYRLGLIYGETDGAYEDLPAALTWLGRAAEQGHEKAKFAYSYLADRGYGFDC